LAVEVPTADNFAVGKNGGLKYMDKNGGQKYKRIQVHRLDNSHFYEN